MGKQNPAQRDIIEKLIYKNSNNTFNTYSKTCSSGSKLFTKSLLLELRRKTLNNDFYESKGKVKRDLSIETDVCRLKRLCKKKMIISVSQLDKSEVSKYSINNTEIDAAEEFILDNSGCGDSETNIKKKNRLNIDLSVLVMKNLRSLLNNWIKSYLLENNETKQKIETILDSILHKLEFQGPDTSSACTYTLDIELVDTKHSKTDYAQTSKDPQQNFISHSTIPLSGKHLKLISTLSVPRNMQRLNRSIRSKQNTNKSYNRKILVSMKKNSDCFLNASNMNFLSVSTKTLTKHCATYKKAKDQEYKDDKWAHYVPRQSNSMSYFLEKHKVRKDGHQNIEFKNQIMNEYNIPSMFKSIYADPARYNSVKKGTIKGEIKSQNEYKLAANEVEIDLSCTSILYKQVPNLNRNEKKVILNSNQNNPLLLKCLSNQNLNHTNRHSKISYKLKTKNKMYNKYKMKYNHMYLKEMSKKRKAHSLNSKYINYLFNKAEYQNLNENDFLDRSQTIFKHVAESDKGKDLKFDIHINIYPTCKHKTEDKDTNIDIQEKTVVECCTNVSKTNLLPNGKCMTTQNVTDSHSSRKVNFTQDTHIISILDGAANRVKYLINRETSTERIQYIDNIKANNCSDFTNKIEKIDISQEIGELRLIVKKLAATAEKFVNFHFYRTNEITNKVDKGPLKKSHITKCTNNKKKSVEVKTKYTKQSKAIQISNIFRKSNITSGVKLTKSPKNKPTTQFNLRLLKKSTSYRIIDSETILKVTDMTSTAGKGTEKMIDEALTCSFPKSKSLFEDSSESNKHELLAFYCDDRNKHEYIYTHNDHHVTKPCSQGPSKHPFIVGTSYRHNYFNRNNYYEDSCGPLPCHSQNCPVYEGDYINGDETVYVNMDDKPYKTFTPRNRRGVGYYKGCLYCILLWIPLFAIAYFFYDYVLKDVIEPHVQNRTGIFSIIPKRFNSTTNLTITMHDLGF